MPKLSMSKPIDMKCLLFFFFFFKSLSSGIHGFILLLYVSVFKSPSSYCIVYIDSYPIQCRDFFFLIITK